MLLIFLLVLLLCSSCLNGLLIKWKNNWNIHYVHKGTGPPLLLIPGFGVGTFHYDKNIDELSKFYSVYSLDLFGQGKSWPLSVDDIKEEHKLVFSTKLWSEQIKFFIENVIQQPTHISGNSLGGYLSVILANDSPQLVKSLSLTNPTPFWSFFDDSWPIWGGQLPAPNWALQIGSTYFNGLKSKSVVNTMLTGVYANENAFDEKLVQDIIESAGHPVGPYAFTSILFAKKEERDFDTLLSQLKVPSQLIMGAKDPWIVPYWGQRFKRLKKDMPYFEITESGHCPHHESPKMFNLLMNNWIKNVEAGQTIDLDSKIELTQVEDHGVEVTARLVDGSPSSNNFFEIIGEWIHKKQLEKI